MKYAFLVAICFCALAVNVSSQPNNAPANNSSSEPPWYTALERPDWWLVGVGIGAILVGWRTLADISEQTRLLGQYVKATNDGVEATRKSAEATEKSVKLQEVNMQQWVDVNPSGLETPGSAEKPFEFRPLFEAVNNTAFALTICKVVTKVSINAGEWETFTVDACDTLQPSGRGRRDTYAFYVELQLDELRPQWFQGLILTINGEVAFKDCLQNMRTQQFGGLYKCGPVTFTYLKPVGIVPVKGKEYDGDYPN